MPPIHRPPGSTQINMIPCCPFRHLTLICLIFLTTTTTCALGFLVAQPQNKPRRHYAFPQDRDEELNNNAAMARYTLQRIAAAVLSVPPDVFALSPPMIAPPTRSAQQKAHRGAISRALSQGWNQAEGFDIPHSENLIVNQQQAATSISNNDDHRRPSTYGEVTELGARQIFWYMNLLQGKHNDNNVNFFDLGSGAGKLVLQAYMELPSLSKSSGIELAPSRHAIAVKAYENLQSTNTLQTVRSMGQRPVKEAVVELHQGDLFDLDVGEATHVYLSSLCFTDEMMQRVAEKLVLEAPHLKSVATLQESTFLEVKFGPAKMEFVEMSWTKPRGQGCPVYFYDSLYVPVSSIITTSSG